MRLVVVDTNVLISAGLDTRSIPFRIVYDWILRGQVQMIACPTIVAEYREVFCRSKFRRHPFPPAWLEPLLQQSILVADPQPWPVALPDRDDGVFLALASMSGAALVTGNMKHYPPEVRDNVLALTPAEYLRRLESA